MIGLIHSVVAFISTTIGAIIGIGGGVIIKPTLAILNYNDVTSITMLTTLTVLTMSFVSTAKHLSNKTKLDGKLTIFIVIGSIFGGMIGGKIFDLITVGYNLEVISIIQSIIFVIMLTFVIFYVLNKSKFKQYQISNPLFCIA